MPYHNDLINICQSVKERLMILNDLLTILRQFFVILPNDVKYIVLCHINHSLTVTMRLPLSFMKNAFYTWSVAKNQLSLFLSVKRAW